MPVRLKYLRDRLGTSGGSVTGQNRHCLLDFVDTHEHFSEWLRRIENIPTWFIEETCWHIIRLGVGRRIANLLVDFLEYRKESLEGMILQNKADFPQIKTWDLFIR